MCYHFIDFCLVLSNCVVITLLLSIIMVLTMSLSHAYVQAEEINLTVDYSITVEDSVQSEQLQDKCSFHYDFLEPTSEPT